MLYDNALLIIALSEAFQLTGKPQYGKAIRETMQFIESEMLSPEGGFYSALDADSEGEEGKFYTWQRNEIYEVLGKEADRFSDFFDVTERGNWEGKNILRIKDPKKLPSEVKEREWKQMLMARRTERIRPLLDDKILSGWNALMITACCSAFSALGEAGYRDLAVKNAVFLEKKMRGAGIYHFYHSYKEGKASIPAFLDDYAYLTEAYIHLQEVTGDSSYLIRAKELADWVIESFSEEDTGFFYYTASAQDDVIVRKTEVYDGAIPSGNSVMAANLLYLGTIFDLKDWKKRATRNATGLKEMVTRYPGSFGVWATLINALSYQLNEIVLAGSYSDQKHREFLARAIPNRVFQISSVTHSDFPLLRNKPVQGPPQFFLCRDYTCQQPVKEVAELMGLLKNS